MSDGGLIASERPLEVQIKTNRRISPRERRHRRCIKRGEAIEARKAIMATRTRCVPGVGEVRSACHSDRLFNDHLFNDHLPSNRRAQPIVGPILQARAAAYMLKRA